jgi:hypothetical protein
MKTVFQITTKETGVIVLRRRKIAKAFRWWLRENGYVFKSTHCINDTGIAFHGSTVTQDYSLNFDR